MSDLGLSAIRKQAKAGRYVSSSTVLILIANLEVAQADRERLAAQLQQIRVALAGHPHCDRHTGDDPITCGWKQAVLDVQAALEKE